MYICLKPYISTRIYKAKVLFGFILDERSHIYYIIKDKSAELWNIIVDYKDYERVYEFAKENNLEKELLDFLAELKQKEIIEIEPELPCNERKYLNNTIYRYDTKAFNIFNEYFRSMILKNNLLESLSLQLSYQCNLSCRHCYNQKNKNEYKITYDTAKKITEEAYALGITNVGMTGGECTINEDFLKIAKYIREKHLSWHFLTNGQTLYNTDFFDEVINLYPNQIQISLYSMNPEIHDYITGVKGSHKKTLFVIRKLAEHNIDTVINYVQLSLNRNQYNDVQKFADSINVKSKAACGFINNVDNHNLYAKLPYEELEKFFIEQLGKTSERIPEFKKDDSFVCNAAGITLLNLSPNLDITPCNDFKYILGNYNSISLKDLWNGRQLIEFRAKFHKCNLEECFKYEYCKYCSYCPEYAMFDGGFMKKSPATCELAKAHYNAVLHYKNKG